jgi:hypothetical protein
MLEEGAEGRSSCSEACHDQRLLVILRQLK